MLSRFTFHKDFDCVHTHSWFCKKPNLHEFPLHHRSIQLLYRCCIKLQCKESTLFALLSNWNNAHSLFFTWVYSISKQEPSKPRVSLFRWIIIFHGLNGPPVCQYDYSQTWISKPKWWRGDCDEFYSGNNGDNLNFIWKQFRNPYSHSPWSYTSRSPH